MLQFDRNGHRFNFRSAAVCLHAGRVLIHRATRDDFWSLPGGRVEFFESSRDTVERELKEEIGVDWKAARLLWLVEDFFRHEGICYHEIGHYFLMDLPDCDPRISEDEFEGQDIGLTLLFKWIELPQLASIVIYPEFLKTGLGTLPEQTEHLLINELDDGDGDTGR